MANYNINVKATVNVSQVSRSIKEALANTIIRVAPKFDVFADDNHVKNFRDQVANILEKQPVPITLAEPTDSNIAQILGKINSKFIVTPTIKFDSKKDSDFQNKLKNIKDAIDEFSKSSTAIVSFFVDTNNYNELKKVLENIKNEKQNVSKIDIKFAYNEQEVKKLEDLFHDLNGGIEQLDKGAIEISFAPISDEYLIPIKTKIDQYFKDNPITLTIAETTGGIDLKSLIESFQEYQKTIKAITVDGLENQRASLRIQANDLKEYYNGGITSAQEYRDKLKALLEDQQNDAILSAKGSAKTREDLARELSRIEVQIANQTKAEQEEIQQAIADNWKKSIDDAFESLQSGGSFKKFQKELEALKENGLQLNISDAQEYYDKVLKDGTEYIANLKEQNKQIGTMKGEITRLFNLVSEGKTDISEWDERIEKWQSKPIFQTEQVQEHFTKLSDIIDAQYEAMIEKQKKAQEEAEKEIELLQEQIHLRSEIRSSMFEDVDSGINTQQQALDEKKQEFENYLNSLETIQKHTTETTQVLEKAFNEDIQNIFRNYQRHTTDFEAFNDDFWKRVKQASEQGISGEVIQKAEDKWDKIADAHQKSVDKINQQQEKANQKAEQERQKEEQRIVKYLEDTRNKILKEEEEKLRQQEQAWNKETQDLQEKYNKQLISTEEYIEKMEILVKQGFDNGYDKANHYSNSLEQVKKKQEEAGQSADNLGNKVNNLGSRFDNVFNSLMRYFGVTKIFDAVQSSFSKMIQEVRDLDVELTEFSKVTDLTSQQTEKFIDKAYELGDAVARTGTEVVQATTLFKKMGYELQESMDFAKDALMWTNVADGLVTVESAATMLISTMKAFEEQGISSTHVIDALNEVSNNYSTSSSALSDNLSAVSATLAVSGTSFEQTIGLMTAGIEIMPDKASKVANGLKTISQRIRQIDGDTADKLDEFLGSKGLSRYDELTGQLKGTYDILEEVSKIWDTLTINERQYIGEVMAGKNQITVLNALMMNFATAINATETAMNSAGSAARENERVLDSIQGHIQRFQSAFEELSQNLINSDVFKQVVDFGTNLIKILNTLAKNSVSLTLILSGVGITTAVNWWQRLGEAFQQAQTRASELNQTLQSTNRIDYFASTISGLQTVIATASIAITMFTALNQHYQNIEAEKKRTIQDNIDNRKKEFDSIEQLKKLEEEYLKTDIKDTEKRNQLFEKIYDKKVEIANLDNDGLSRNKLLNTSIGEQNDLYDNQLDKVSRTTLELIRQKQLLEEYGKSNIFAQFFANLFPNAPWLEENINPLGDFYNNDYFGGKNFQDFYDTTLVSIQNKIETLTSLQNHIEEIRNSFDPGTEYYELYNQQYDFLAEKIEKLKGKNDEISASAEEAAKTTLGDLSTYTDEQLEAMSKVFDAYANFGISGAEGLELALKELVDVFGSDLEENFLQEIQDKFNDPEIAQGALNLINYFLEVKKAASDIPYSYSEAMGEMLSVVTSTTTKIQERYDLLTQAVDEFNESGVITKETLQSLTENDLLKYLQILDGQIVLDTKAFDEDTKATKENSASKIDNQLNANLLKLANEKLKDSLNDLKPGSDNASDGIDNVSVSAIEATKTLIECGLASDETAKALNELGKLIGKEDLNLNNFDAEGFVSEAQRLIDAANNAKNALNDFNPTINRGASSSRTSSGSSSSSSSSASRQADREAQQAQRDAERAQREAEQAAKRAQQDWKEAFKVEYNKLKTYLDSEIITYEQYYAALEELNKHFFEGRSEFEEEYWKYQDEIIKGRKKYLEDELENYFKKGENILKHQLNVEYITEEEYYDALTLLYESYYTDKEKYEEKYWKLEEEIYKLRKKQIKELEDELKDLYKEIEDLHKEYVKSLEDDLDEVETTISFAIDVIDEEIQKLKDEKTAIDEANEAREESIKLQELEDALEKAKNKKVRVYKKGEGFVYEQDTTAISQAQTALDKYKQEAQHKKRLSNIDEEIKKLEEYKKEWQNISVNYKKAQDEMTAKAILGESAREEVLRREHNAVTKVGNRYVAVKNAIIKANEATIDNLEAYIGDATQAGTFSYEIERIKNKINEIQSKTVTLQVNTSQASTSVSNIIVAIDALKNKLESKYSTQNLNAWLASYKSMINEAYHYNPSGGSTGGGSGSSGGGSSSGGNNQSDSGNTNTPDGKPAIGTHVRLKQPNNYLYGDQEFEIWGYDYKGDPQIRWLGSSDKDNPTYAVSLSELEGYGENTDTNIVNPGDTITEDGVYKYADQNGNYTPMDVIWEGGQKYYYNPVTGQKIPVVSGGGGEAGVYNGGGGSDDDIYYYEPIDWQRQGYESIGEYYADYRRQMEDYYHNLYGYHASGTIGTTTKKFVINENGIEAMVTPDGTVISAPSTGYGVIKNEYTKRLTDFAADPLSFLSRMFTGYSGTYQNNNNAKNEVININGNLTLPNVTDGQSFVDSIRNVALQYTTRRR